MRQVFIVLAALIAGPVCGWLLLGGMCGVILFVTDGHSNACGHNAYLWIPIFLPLGMIISGLAASRLWKMAAHKKFSFNFQAASRTVQRNSDQGKT